MIPMPTIPDSAVAVSAFRALPDGSGRQYTISDPSRGRATIVKTAMMARAVGYIAPPDSGTPYAVIDLLDAGNDIVGDIGVPNAAAWSWWHRKLHLTVATDADGAR